MPESSIPNKVPPDPRYRISVVDHTGRLEQIQPLQQAVQVVLAGCDVPRSEISIAVVDDDTIHRINRDHLGHDWPTDVITFPGDDPLEAPELNGLLSPEKSGLVRTVPAVFGEIIVSLDTALSVAAEYSVDWWGELLLYTIHGTLHLAGFDDHQAGDEAAMRDAERLYLAQLGYQRLEIPESGDDA